MGMDTYISLEKKTHRYMRVVYFKIIFQFHNWMKHWNKTYEMVLKLYRMSMAILINWWVSKRYITFMEEFIHISLKKNIDTGIHVMQ